MSFTPTPLDGSSTPLPMSSAVPDGTNTPLAIEGGPVKSTGGNSLVPVATYHYDGYDVTQGSKADTAATDNTSAWSIVALLKGLWGFLSTLASTVSGGKIQVSGTFYQATQPVSGTVTATIDSTNSTHLANIDTATSSSKIDLDSVATNTGNINTVTGTQADSTYTSGNGSVIALLKGIFGKLANTLTVAGTVTANVTFPGQQAVNIDQVNGAALSITNPLLSQHPKTAQVFAGNTYSMTTSKFFSSAGNNGFTMFNNSTAKTIVIRSIQAFDATNPPYFHLMKITSYTAFSDAITPVNHLFNGAASAIADHCSASINSAFSTVTGTEMRCLSQLTSGTLEMLNDGSPIILPANTANGIVLYTNTGAGGNNLGFTVEWDER